MNNYKEYLTGFMTTLGITLLTYLAFTRIPRYFDDLRITLVVRLFWWSAKLLYPVISVCKATERDTGEESVIAIGFAQDPESMRVLAQGLIKQLEQ